jgi:hypothetical protein
MKTMLKVFLTLVMILGLVGIIQAQGTIAITKSPAYIPVGNTDATQVVPFAIYVTVSGAQVSTMHFMKVGDPNFTLIGNQLYTYRNGPLTAPGTWGNTTSYNDGNFQFMTDASGAWEGWVPVKAHRSGIAALNVRARAASGTTFSGGTTAPVSGMLTAGTGAGFLVGNLLDGTATKENKIVVAYNGTTMRGIWFSEPDSVNYVTTPIAIAEGNTDYSTAVGLRNALGGYAMLLPSGTTSVDKIEVYDYPNNLGSTAPVASNLITYSNQNITVPDSIPAAGRNTSVAIASDITLNVFIPDGAGSASLTNETVGLFTGATIFSRNAGSQTVKVTITGIPAGPLDEVQLTIPTSDFTGFSSGNVTLGGAFAGKTPSFTSNTITIPSANLSSTPGTITITGLASPNPVGSLLNGNSIWKVETAASGGTLTEIVTSPRSYTMIPIANIRTGGDDGYGNNATGDTSKMNTQKVAVAGVTTVEDKIIDDIPTHTSFFLQEAGHGIQIYRASVSSTTIARGDSLIILGSVDTYNGQTEVVPLSTAGPNLFVIGTGVMPSPVVLANAAAINESYEGRLIKLNSVNWNSAGSTFTDTISAGRSNFTTGTDSGTIIISKNNGLYTKAIPVSSQLVGIIYERKDIVTGGAKIYKVAPRDVIDLGIDPADGTGIASIKPANQFSSVTAVRETLVVKGNGIYSLNGVSVTLPSTWSWDGSSYSTAGPGFTSSSSAVSGIGSSGDPYVITISNTAVTGTDTGIVIITNLNTPGSLGLTTFAVKTKGSTGALSLIASSPTVNIAGAFEAIATGNWNSGSTWSGGVPPVSTNDVSFATKNVVVTITADAECRNLTMVGFVPTGSDSGQVLQFSPTGTITLTVNGRLDLSGGSGGGGGLRGGRPKFTSNGNNDAVLIANSYIFTNVSNLTDNGSAGINMNEGTVKLFGSTADSIKSSAGFRLGNLIVGDGTNTKNVTWYQTGSGSMLIRSLLIKSFGSLVLGGTSNSNQNSVGNFSYTGVPMLTGGITIENNASLTVNNSTIAGSYSHINMKNGGITNNGTLNLVSTNGYRRYFVDFGEQPADLTGSKQIVGGANTGTYSFVKIGTLDTVTLNQSINVVDSLVLLNGEIVETAGHFAQGTVKSTRLVNQDVENKFGGIGVSFNAAGAAPGSTTIKRITGVPQTGNGGNQSILRYYDVTPSVNAGLNASTDFYYDDNDLNGQDASSLLLWKSTDIGVTWMPQPATLDLVNHRLHATGINSFSLWTMSDYAHALGSLSKDYVYNLGWNMISMPLTISDSLKTNIFPDAISDAFAYEGNYVSKDYLRNGVGYWLKFAAQDTISMTGFDRFSDTVFVNDGWNMIGTLSKRVLVSAIEQIPADIVKSSYFGYTNTYNSVDTLEPGQSYWVKTAGGGKLYMSALTVLARQTSSRKDILNEMNSLKITDKNGISQTLYFGSVDESKYSASYYEMPPVGFDDMFDVRFGTQRYAESIPAKLDNIRAIPIDINASAYPLTISWNVKSNGPNAFVLNESGKNKQALDGEGKITISKVVKSLSLEVSSREVLPTQFSLSGNYPNPFNPSTKFVVAVPKTALVGIVVYDILGRQVRTLVNEQKSAGYHTIEWNGLSDDGGIAPSGVYFVRMVSEKFNTTQKIMMLK